MKNNRIVSHPDEPLILVDQHDRILGYCDKTECHRGEGLLHRAFSIFLFNGDGELLLQQRSPSKPLWGGYWSNTVCSHPRKDESYDEATQRRLMDELGITADLTFLFRFRYQATFGAAGSENELCSVFVGRHDGPVHVNPHEIMAIRWIHPDKLDEWMETEPGLLTPWFRMEWRRIRAEHWPTVRGLSVPV